MNMGAQLKQWVSRFAGSPAALPDAVVTPQWLKEHNGRVNLLDATFALPNSGRDPAAEFAAQHIPGAQFFNIEQVADKNTELPHMLPAPEAFAAALQKLGFDERKPTVIYDDGAMLGASRLWWMLRVFGYDNSAILDGGLPGWIGAGYSGSRTVTKPRTGHFTPKFRPELVWSQAQVSANLANGEILLLDARPLKRFTGEAAEPRPGLERGHIPGSLNLPFVNLVDATYKNFLSPEQLRAAFIAAGVYPNEPLTVTCGSGVSACVLAFGLYRLGRDDIPVYDGSWAEWGQGGQPVMQGPPQRLKQGV